MELYELGIKAAREGICREMRGLECLSRCVRRIEKSFVHTLGLSESCTDLKSAANGGKSVGGKLNSLCATRDISAALCHSAAGVLYKRADYHIRADSRRLTRFCKLAVAVVYHDISIGAKRTNEAYHVSDIVNAKRFSVEISL